MATRKSLYTLLLTTILMLALALSACTAPAAAPADGGETDSGETDGGEQAAADTGDKPVIKLAENPWSAAALNTAIARILLEEQLGYEVEVVAIGESAQWPALASGDLSASLEVWPSGHGDNVAEYIENQGLVENGGLLGPVGKIGWYMPSYLLDVNSDLATGEGLATADAAALFATAETGDKGQFLTGDPSWTAYEEQIIDNLGMDFQIVAAGSEEALLAALDGAYSREEPILFYFWTPHSVHAQYELTEVALPAYSDECYAMADDGGVDCDYPSDDLFKILWAGLAEAAPDAHALLTNMNYTTEDQIGMVAAVELEGEDVDDAARAWLDANEDIWGGWLQ